MWFICKSCTHSKMLTYNNLSLSLICPCSKWLGFVTKISTFQKKCMKVWSDIMLPAKKLFFVVNSKPQLLSQEFTGLFFKEVHTHYGEFSRKVFWGNYSVIQLCLCNIFFIFRRISVKHIRITLIIWNLIAHQILQNTCLSKIS